MMPKTESKNGMWDLNFPKETAIPEKPFWKNTPSDFGASPTLQDLLSSSYPDPIRQAIVRLEKLGYDVEGLWIQYLSMKHCLKTNAQIFRDILALARVRAAAFKDEEGRSFL